jgi:hypothetical protein
VIGERVPVFVGEGQQLTDGGNRVLELRFDGSGSSLVQRLP